MAFARFGKALNSLGEHLKQTPVAEAFAESGWRGVGGSLKSDAKILGFQAMNDTPMGAMVGSGAWDLLKGHEKLRYGAGFAARTPAGYGAVVGAGAGMVFGDDRQHGLMSRAARGGMLGAGAGLGYMGMKYLPETENIGHLKGSWTEFSKGWKSV